MMGQVNNSETKRSEGRSTPLSQRNPPHGSALPGVLNGAHDFVMHNPTFVYKVDKPLNDPIFLENFRQNLDYGGTVLLILDKKRVIGVEVDSSDREYAPRCHPETRKELRTTLKAWLANDRRHRSFVWLTGPAGVGKSAVAQTFAEYCLELGQLGATFFFSKFQNRNSPHGLIATIAYQLADQHAGYNHLITRILSRSPAILDKTLRVQFQKLIVEPFTTLANDYTAHDITRKPLVIIIDGLDECSDERAQCEFIRLIAEYVRRYHLSAFPVLWLVCSRPEWHLKRQFACADPPIDYDREEMTCNAAEDLRDVYHILKGGLQDIRHNTTWSLRPIQSGSQWPPESKLQRLSLRVGGLPVLASTVLRFIDDGSAAPDALLDICLLYLEDMGDASKINPLEMLDAFYMRIMMRVPQSILFITKRIIAFRMVSFSYQNLSAFDAAYFLHIDKDTFYLALRSLHSVINVPPSELGYQEPFELFHKSFGDFLLDPIRSKSFSLDLDEARFELAKLTLRWYNHFLQCQCELPNCSHPALDETSFSDPHLVVDPNIYHSWSYSVAFDGLPVNHWGAICANVRGPYKSLIAAEISGFNFCHFDLTECKDLTWMESIKTFLAWYLDEPQLDDPFEEPLVRFRPMSQFDEKLAETSSITFPLRDSLPEEFLGGRNYDTVVYFRSLHSQRDFTQKPDPRSVKMGFWIGRGAQTALALLIGPPELAPMEVVRINVPSRARPRRTKPRK